MKTYTLSCGSTYKPDFFLPEENKFVEIKGDFNYKNDIEKILTFSKEFSIEVEVLTEKALRSLLSFYSLNFDQLRKEWKYMSHVTRGLIPEGIHNPRYGCRCSEATKLKIKTKALERMSNKEYKTKWLNSEARKAYHQNRIGIEGKRKPREILVCKYCGCNFKVIEGNIKDREFCSISCSNKHRSSKFSPELLDFVMNLCLENQPLSIKSIDLILEKVLDRFDIEDVRTLCKHITEEQKGKRYLLSFLNDHIENVLGANANKEALEVEDKEPLR